MILVWLWSYFYTFLPCNQQFASQFSYHCNSLIFSHYVKCDTSTPKCRKWRERCTGQNHDLEPFNGSQRGLLYINICWQPCTNSRRFVDSSRYHTVMAIWRNLRASGTRFMFPDFPPWRGRQVASGHVSRVTCPRHASRGVTRTLAIKTTNPSN